ncbi:hypothetical protein SDC9_162793 [bioreactor metagenome]|uniref:Uncharacterized protein n=1 Tax=bioreactor metagenome TaxID=1076179 RepID=A0A645FQ16_9ZZZZ
MNGSEVTARTAGTESIANTMSVNSKANMARKIGVT